jgi:hypothetical protein
LTRVSAEPLKSSEDIPSVFLSASAWLAGELDAIRWFPENFNEFFDSPRLSAYPPIRYLQFFIIKVSISQTRWLAQGSPSPKKMSD